jgi:hypothetical protein
MKAIVKLFLLVLFSNTVFSQGLINNGASITFTGGGQIYIDGTLGHYTNQLGGLITPSASSTITLIGDWRNNSSPANVVFTTDGGGVVLAGAAQNISGTGGATAFYNLSLTGSGVKTLAVNSTTVGGQAAFNGVLSLGNRPLDLNSNRLDITNASLGAVTRASGYIISETALAVNPSIIRWYHRLVGGSKVYPFGVSAGFYIPFTFNITTPMTNATAYVDVSTRPTASDNLPWSGVSNVGAVAHMYSPNVPYLDGTIPAVIDRWWDISNSHAVTADATFSYLGTENTLNPLYSPGLIGAQYWDGTGWLPNNAVIGSGVLVSGVGVVGTVTAPGLSTFCPWVLSAALSPLPIELLNFDATCNNYKVLLNWCTATEKNNDYFTVQQSTNGIDFYPIGNINGNGTTGSKHCYSYETSVLLSGINYFKLMQTDFSSKTTSSKIISINGCGTTSDNIVITNNGSTDVGVLVNSKTNQKLILMVHNSLGQLVFENELNVTEGFNSLIVNLSNLSSALYYVSIFKDKEQVSNKKIVLNQK